MFVYIPKCRDFQYRIGMCNGAANGDEFEDAIRALTSAANTVHAWDDYISEIILLIAEKMCHDYIKSFQKREVDWEEYDELNPEVYKHFTGGNEKLTKEEYESR